MDGSLPLVVSPIGRFPDRPPVVAGGIAGRASDEGAARPQTLTRGYSPKPAARRDTDDGVSRPMSDNPADNYILVPYFRG